MCKEHYCLNPCFVGIWSCREKHMNILFMNFKVLILVLLGYGLVGLVQEFNFLVNTCLNPCFVGIWSCSY